MGEIERLLITIEDLRRQLNQLSQGRTLDDPSLRKASERLDSLLNEYYRRLNDFKDGRTN